MNKPKSITQLSKEQLEDMCLNLMHVDKVKTEMINQLETNIDEAISLGNKQLLSNSNYTGYSDEMCLKEMLEILERGKE